MGALLVMMPFAAVPIATAQTTQVIYADSLQNGWQNWSWADVDLVATGRVHGGTHAIAVTASNWQALYLHATTPVDPAVFTGVTFWVNGGAVGGQAVQVQATVGNVGQTPHALAPLPANAWRTVSVSLTQLGITNGLQMEGLWLQVATTAAVPTFFVDTVSLTGPSPQTPPPERVPILVDAAANRHPISPLIYGVNFGGSNELRAMNATLNRHGGNLTSRYNWLTNASNHASDWYFQSLPQSGTGPGAAVDGLIAQSLGGGAIPMVTIPINGWVAKLGPGGQRLSSFSIARYGAQTGNDWQWFPDAGNGLSAATGMPITTNNPHDANQPASPAFQAAWVQHLLDRWGPAAQHGVRYYLMDNEWAIWHETHRDVMPIGVTMDQARDRFCDYAAMVKDLDPQAQVLGPEEFGWSGYWFSGYDLQWGAQHGWSGPFPDRAAHGGAMMMPWWLNAVRVRSEAEGRRLLDVFTLHYYPQGGEFSDDVSTAMQRRRNRSTRSLWDPRYTDESWINDTVQLIPLMKSWVASNYPGTPIGITEYSWGADSHMNGGTAQADALGIFGREGLAMATRWVAPPVDSPAYRAFQMFRNFDGAHGCFGDLSVSATVPNADEVSAFAAEQREFGNLTLVVINKQLTAAATVDVTLTNFHHLGLAQGWQFAANLPITRLPDVDVAPTLVLTLPPQSITTLLVPGRPRLDRIAVSAPEHVAFRLCGAKDLTYVVESSSRLNTWQEVATHRLISNSIPVLLSTTQAPEYYRARWLP